MKRICFVLSMLFLFVFFANSVLAEEIWVIEDDGLIPYQREENCPIYPIPPEGISAEIAGKLIREEISEYIIQESKEIEWTLKPFWHLRKIEIIPQTKVFYSASAWISEEILPLKSEKNNYLGIIFFLIMPVIGILVASIANQNAKLGNKKLFVFYGMILILIIFSASISFFIGKAAGVFAGLFVGIFVGGFIGWVAGRFDGVVAGAIAGMLVGAFVGRFTNDIAMIRGYLIFIALACLLSFIAAKVIKRLWPLFCYAD